MRRLRVIFAVALVSASLAACNAILDIDPPNVVDDEDANVTAPSLDADVPLDGGGSEGTSYPPCPQGQVRAIAERGAFCIDQLEVSVAAYGRFLEAGAPSAKHPSCVWKTAAQPDQWATQTQRTGRPVVNVDWCDAYDFCAWRNARLCGRIGVADAGAGWLTAARLRESQWYTACSSDGTRAYPYGDTYVAAACNVKDLPDARALEPATARPACITGDGGARNLVGNAIEWIDACEKDTRDAAASRDRCSLYGASFRSSEAVLDCSFALPAERRFRSDDVGFRCCSD